MADRCQHFMLKGKCAIRACSHSDGGRPRQKLETDFVRCYLEGCRKPIRRADVIYVNRHPICKDCYVCEAECGQPRRSGSRYCKACFDKMAKPKKCQGCDTILKPLNDQDKSVLKHSKRVRCLPCGRRHAQSIWY